MRILRYCFGNFDESSAENARNVQEHKKNTRESPVFLNKMPHTPQIYTVP